MPLSPRKARHFPPRAGEANAKEKAIKFYKCEQKRKNENKYEQTRKKVSYKTAVNTCLSFLNEVMASEPLFEEQSDAAKVSETPYPTNGSGKNLGKEYGC